MLVEPVGLNELNHIFSKEEKTKGYSLISEDDLFVFLKKRAGKLDAVVITGGEPTLHRDLPKFIKKIRLLGYKIKLDTNGTNSKMIKKLIKEKLIDYIAMDVKTSFAKYDLITGVKPDLEEIKKSIRIIIDGGVDYEFRTTVVPRLVEEEDIKEIGRLIKGADKWFLQGFKSDIDLVEKELKGTQAFTSREMNGLLVIAKKYVNVCEKR